MTTPVAARALIAPFHVMEAFREAAELEASGKDIIHLSLGQPARCVPRDVMEKVAEKMKETSCGYTESRGLPELRERIAEHYRTRYGLDIPARRIFITVGSSAAMMLSMLSAFDAEQTVAMARPYYPAYPNMLKALDLVPVFLDTGEETGFQPEVDHLARLENRPNGLIVASPSNPVGSIISPESLKRIAEYAEDYRIRIISDEIYHGVSYGAETESILRFSKHAFAIGSFSKYYLLPGFRLGWAVVPDSHCRAFESLTQSLFISPPTMSQYAALEVFDHLDYLDETVAHYSENRDLLVPVLRMLGFKGLRLAEGAFYLYANISALSNDSREFCRRMLHEAGVSAVPGLDFDDEKGQQYVRFSYAGDHLELAEAAERLRVWLGGR